MEKVKQNIVDYLEEEVEINLAALKGFDKTPNDPIGESEGAKDVFKISDGEAKVLRDRIHELKRHIAVIKRMIV